MAIGIILVIEAFQGGDARHSNRQTPKKERVFIGVDESAAIRWTVERIVPGATKHPVSFLSRISEIDVISSTPSRLLS